MKRIGNFLFIEQWFNDHKPEQAVINIDVINHIYASELLDGKQHTLIKTQNEDHIAITGEHADNIIELSELLKWYTYGTYAVGLVQLLQQSCYYQSQVCKQQQLAYCGQF